MNVREIRDLGAVKVIFFWGLAQGSLNWCYWTTNVKLRNSSAVSINKLLGGLPFKCKNISIILEFVKLAPQKICLLYRKSVQESTTDI